MATQTISKWCSSLAFRLPTAFAKQMRLEEGAKVQLTIDGKRLVIQRAESTPDANAFFATVKVSQASRGLVQVGMARGKEIRRAFPRKATSSPSSRNQMPRDTNNKSRGWSFP